MNHRERTEAIEKQILSPYATLSEKSKGRDREVEPCPVRTCFQRDRDRIVHSKAFRRLKHKTQVFIRPEGDHYRTRLTHTLEVSQIARTISRGLCLNEDLTEAIALGHDLGHTPFGHAGEQALDEICPMGFRHYEQSLRVVEVLEDGGMNLTREVRDGIVNHTGEHVAETLEGRVIKFADRIAYINHDIDDAIRGGILSEEDLPKDTLAVLGRSHGERINTMIVSIIENSFEKPDIMMGDEVLEKTMKLRKFLFDTVYIGSAAKHEEGKAIHIIKVLYEHFLKDPSQLPEEYKAMLREHQTEQVVADYIAGMTDGYAIRKFQELYLPLPWMRM